LRLHPFGPGKFQDAAAQRSRRLRRLGTGGYSGIVEHEFEYVPSYADAPFAFKTYFIAVKSAE